MIFLIKAVKYFVSFVLFISLFNSCGEKTAYRTVDGFTQGTTFHIVYQYEGEAMDSVIYSVFKDIDYSLSVYNDSSLITAVNLNRDVLVDSLFVNVFNRASEIWYESEGAFDISAAPLFEVWGFGKGEPKHVTDAMIDSIMAFVGMDKVSILNGRVIKSDSRVSLNANAIAKGYTSDVVGAEFDRLGIENYLIEVGGEIFCRGVNSKGDKWSVAIDRPVEGNMIQGADIQEVIYLSNRGLATSGNYRKFIEEDGVRYAHTIDPVKGRPVKHNLLSATVLAHDTMTADAYATWFMVIGFEKAKAIVESRDDIDALLIYDNRGQYEYYASSGIELRR